MFGNRALYHEGWVASTRHSTPWLMVKLPPLEDDTWELYNVAEDFSQANDLAAQNPAKLKELQDLFMKEAVRNHVLPLDDRRSERFDPSIAGRPDLLGPRTSLTLYEGMTGIAENAFINVKSRSHTITAEIEVPKGGAEGVIIAQAGRFGGWSLYMKGGRVHHVHNFGGLERTTVSSAAALAPGRHTVRYEFAHSGGPPGSGGTSRLIVDRLPAAEAKVPRLMPFAYSADEGTDVGMDSETPVTEEYAQGRNRFTGRIHTVTVDNKPGTRGT
jgi:arylsulfatase